MTKGMVDMKWYYCGTLPTFFGVLIFALTGFGLAMEYVRYGLLTSAKIDMAIRASLLGTILFLIGMELWFVPYWYARIQVEGWGGKP